MDQCFFSVDHDVLNRAIKGWEKQVDDLVEELFAAGKIKEKHADKNFFSRLTHVNKEFPGVSILLHKKNKLCDAAKDLWSYPKLLDVMEQLLGPEVAGNPLWNLRVKLPKHGPEVVPWHQVFYIIYEN